MIQLNLLPEVKKEFIQARKARNKVVAGSIIISVVAAGITVLAVLTVYGGQALTIGYLDGQIKSNAAKLTDQSDGSVGKDLSKYLTIQNQLAALPELHASKTTYARVFDILPQLNPKSPNTVSLSSVVVSEQDKSITLTGTTNDFVAMNVFKDTLVNADVAYRTAGQEETSKSKLFESVEVVSAGLSRANNRVQVSFVINLTYPEAVLLNGTSDFAVSVPSKETTQSVVQSPDRAVFGGGQ